jgi:hypothetical protein
MRAATKKPQRIASRFSARKDLANIVSGPIIREIGGAVFRHTGDGTREPPWQQGGCSGASKDGTRSGQCEHYELTVPLTGKIVARRLAV